nr:MAG: hypothetical protein [Bacteriophage sp.]
MKMTAREMFEKLGYSLKVDNNYLIEYSKEDCGHIAFCFDIETKRFYSWYSFSSSIQSTPHSITLDEFEAVQKQMEELGWLEEEEKPETNYEHFKDEILEDYSQNLAVVKGRPTLCYKTNCNDCDFKINQIGCREKAKNWLKQPHEKLVYKLTKFEIDLLQSCSQGYSPKYQFKNINSLTEMRKNGYFKCINRDETIEEIIAKSEVVG